MLTLFFFCMYVCILKNIITMIPVRDLPPRDHHRPSNSGCAVVYERGLYQRGARQNDEHALQQGYH